MNLAKISINGQITLPVDIRNILGLRPGDKVLFTENRQGDIVLTNASNVALKKAQKAFSGVAEELNVKNESDVQDLVDKIRYEKD